MKKKILYLGVLGMLAVSLTACSTIQDSVSDNESSASEDAEDSDTASDSENESNEDTAVVDGTDGTRAYSLTYPEEKDSYEYEAWEEESVCRIELEDQQSKITQDGEYGSNVSVDGDVITITGKGDYLLSGSLTNGRIVIDTEENVHLYLNGVTIVSEDGPAIYVENAKNVYISLEEGTSNKISDGSDYAEEWTEDSVDAAIYSRADLILNGAGTLWVEGNYGCGIFSKDDLVIREGNYEVTSVADGIKGKDLLAVYDGIIRVTAGDAALKSSNDSDEEEDEDKGMLYIAGGTFVLDSEDDAIHSNKDAAIVGGDFEIAAGDDGIHADDVLQIKDSVINISESYEGLEGTIVDVIRSTVNIYSEDDGINAASGTGTDGFSMMQPHGSFGAASSNQADKMDMSDESADSASMNRADHSDNMPSDSESSNRPGNMGNPPSDFDSQDLPSDFDPDNMPSDFDPDSVPDDFDPDNLPSDFDQSNRTGNSDLGSTSDDAVSYDHAMHSGHGNRMAWGESTENNGYIIYLEDSDIYMNANGDGVDSNGQVYMYSGNLVVDGPSNDGNAALDYETQFLVTGGTITAVGCSGMLENLSEDSTVPVITVITEENQEAGTGISIFDSEGNEVASYVPVKKYNAVIFAGYDFQEGESYTAYAGEEEIGTCTIDGVLNQIGESGSGRNWNMNH